MAEISKNAVKRAKGFLLFVCCSIAVPAFAINASDRYRSPRNPERKVRQSTELIVLHTTEAPARSSLNKLCDRGECHFCVTEDGSVYRIVDRDREAFHAGRSMWNGRDDVDKFSIGIECVGYHDKSMPMAQIAAIRDLVKELKAMYRISDDRVVAHSHVAYGAPNKWHPHKHRGRKRCGMLFAMASVRAQLGLKSRPAYDPDTRARRLVQADAYLNRVLYGNVDTMRAAYAGQSAPAQRPGLFSWFGTTANTGGTSAGRKTAKPKAQAPPKSKPKPKPKPTVAKSSASPKRYATVAELKKAGFVFRGCVSKKISAVKLAGAKWNTVSAYYVLRRKLTPGNEIRADKIEAGTAVWVKRK